MKDERVVFVRKALEGLIESLAAQARLARWDEAGDAVPEPLKESASKLLVRLGTADRLASSGFKGTIADTARVNAMVVAMRRLDAAYVSYRQRTVAKPNDIDGAAVALDAEIDEVKAAARGWA